MGTSVIGPLPLRFKISEDLRLKREARVNLGIYLLCIKYRDPGVIVSH